MCDNIITNHTFSDVWNQRNKNTSKYLLRSWKQKKVSLDKLLAIIMLQKQDNLLLFQLTKVIGLIAEAVEVIEVKTNLQA